MLLFAAQITKKKESQFERVSDFNGSSPLGYRIQFSRIHELLRAVQIALLDVATEATLLSLAAASTHSTHTLCCGLVRDALQGLLSRIDIE